MESGVERSRVWNGVEPGAELSLERSRAWSRFQSGADPEFSCRLLWVIRAWESREQIPVDKASPRRIPTHS